MSHDSGGRNARRGRRPLEPVYQISGAKRALSEDVDDRLKRYAVSMGIRTVCLPLAVLTDGWLRWLFVAGAVFLPYFAVVIANAGRGGGDVFPTSAVVPNRRALPSAAGRQAPGSRDNGHPGFPGAHHDEEPDEGPPWRSRASA